MYIYYACTKRVHNIIFFSILLEKRKNILNFCCLIYASLLSIRTIPKKNEFNNLSYYIINKEILRDEGEIKKRRTGVDRA